MIELYFRRWVSVLVLVRLLIVIILRLVFCLVRVWKKLWLMWLKLLILILMVIKGFFLNEVCVFSIWIFLSIVIKGNG